MKIGVLSRMEGCLLFPVYAKGSKLLFPSHFPTKMDFFFRIYPVCAVRCVHFILLDMITLIIFGEMVES
jgi:hypothetical protein